jgi:hypothetical protein
MTTRSLFVLLAASSFGIASGSIASHKAFSARSSLVEKQLSVRGGAGPIDPTLAAKIFTGAYLVQGSAAVLAPKPTLKAYGLPHSLAIESLVDSEGLYILSIGIAGYCLLFQATRLHTAFGAVGVAMVAQYAKWLLNDTCKNIGAPVSALTLGLATSMLTCYSGLASPQWADTCLKVVAILNTAYGAFGTLFPKSFGETLGVRNPDKLTTFQLRSNGLWCLAFGIISTALLQGVDPKKAMAYCSVPGLAFFLSDLFITKVFYELGPGPIYFWAALFSVLIGTILL